MVRDSSSSYEIDYVIVIQNFLNPEGHQNRITSYGHFSEGVDFAYWWSCIGKGLRLRLVFKGPSQPAAASLHAGN